jgi:hypothetical protein
VFAAGSPLSVRILVRARQGGRFPLVPAAVLYRADGVHVTTSVGEELELELTSGDAVELTLDLGPLRFGDGRYLFSFAIYRQLSQTEPSDPYDLLDRSYEFEIAGNAPFDTGVVTSSARWTLTAVPAEPSTVAERAG